MKQFFSISLLYPVFGHASVKSCSFFKLNFKLNRVAFIFICSIWQPYQSCSNRRSEGMWLSSAPPPTPPPPPHHPPPAVLLQERD